MFRVLCKTTLGGTFIKGEWYDAHDYEATGEYVNSYWVCSKPFGGRFYWNTGGEFNDYRFSDYFMDIKEYRKTKLEKLNNYE